MTTSRGSEYIAQKLQLRRTLTRHLTIREKLLAADEDHAADPNQDEEERRLSAEGIPSNKAAIQQLKAQLKTLGQMK